MVHGSPGNKLRERAARFRAMGALAPRFRFGLRLTSGGPDVTLLRLPFQRSPVFILVAGVAFALFCIPYFSVNVFQAGADDDSLSSLVFSLFSLFWLLGWSVGVLLLLAVFLILSFGGETLQLRPGLLTLRVEVLRLGLGADFPAEGIQNLRWEPLEGRAEASSSGLAWRGDHLAFDYGGQPVRLGSHLTETRAREIIDLVQHGVIDASPGAALTERDADDTGSSLPTAVTVNMAAGVQRVDPVGTGLPRVSLLMLVLANLIPLAGVLLAGWDIGDIMLVFWAESAIIGFFNLLKMWVIGRWSVLLLGPFFVGHFGGFMIGHLLFIYTLFLSGTDGGDPSSARVLADFVLLWPALLGLVVSHGVSFVINFLGRREYQGTSLNQQMSAPYRRIIVMHVTIIFGGFLTLVFDAPVLALGLLIALKIVVDAAAHKKEHSPD